MYCYNYSFKFNLSPFLLSFCHFQNKKLQNMHPLVSLCLSAHLVAYNDSRTVEGVINLILGTFTAVCVHFQKFVKLAKNNGQFMEDLHNCVLFFLNA